MDDTELMLQAGQLATIDGSPTACICVRSGEVWATRAGDTNDYILAEHDSLPLSSRGANLLKALKPTVVLLRRARACG